MHEQSLTGTDEVSVLKELHLVPPMGLMVLGGDLDLHTAGQVVVLLAAAEAVGVDQLTIDLGAVDFVSVSALSAIAETARTLHARAGSVTLDGSRPIHERVLELLDADGIVLTR